MPFEALTTANLRDRFKPVLLICLVLTAYLPGLDSGFFVFDDFDMVASLTGLEAADAVNFFGHSEGRYWRPLIGVSFLFDVALLGANSAWMHLHNILLHAANTLLVFLIIRLLMSRQDRVGACPLVAAALFAIHPVNTEAVNWISGRTDLLASVFALAGTSLLLHAIGSRKPLFAWLSAATIFLGCLAKEAAFPLFPALFLSLLVVRDWRPGEASPATRISTIGYGLPFLLGGGAYLWLRARAFVDIDQGVDRIIGKAATTGSLLAEQAMTALAALGFYIKKLLLPAPLNFAIDQVSPLYLAAGILVIAAGVCLVRQRSPAAALLMLMLFTLAPALLNAIFHIAWTPYAERYLYLPSAFLCVGLCSFDDRGRLSWRSRQMLVALIFLCSLGLTVQRNLQWMHPVEILADALRHTPDNLSLRINHAIMLADAAGPDAARFELERILSSAPDNQVVRRNLALLSLLLENDPEQARAELEVFFDGTQVPEAATLAIMIEVGEKRLEQAPPGTAALIGEELGIAHRQYYLLTGQPEHLFAAADRVVSADGRASVRRLLVKLCNDPALGKAARARAEALLAAFPVHSPGESRGAE